MKSIKILTIAIIISFAGSFLYSQETAGDTGSSVITEEQNQTVNGGSAELPGKTENNFREGSDAVKSVEKRTSEINPRSENVKKVLKTRTMTSSIPQEDEQTSEVDNSGDDFLLSINEGNFKYKRIPDIKLADKSPSMADNNPQENNESVDAGNSDNSADSGFFGLSKNTADIVAKGGILLLILVIFILYKKRSRSSVRRSSGRNVMNSYRK